MRGGSKLVRPRGPIPDETRRARATPARPGRTGATRCSPRQHDVGLLAGLLPQGPRGGAGAAPPAAAWASSAAAQSLEGPEEENTRLPRSRRTRVTLLPQTSGSALARARLPPPTGSLAEAGASLAGVAACAGRVGIEAGEKHDRKAGG